MGRAGTAGESMGRAGTAGERVRYADSLNGKFYWENGRQWEKGRKAESCLFRRKKGEERESARWGGGNRAEPQPSCRDPAVLRGGAALFPGACTLPDCT